MGVSALIFMNIGQNDYFYSKRGRPAPLQKKMERVQKLLCLRPENQTKRMNKLYYHILLPYYYFLTVHNIYSFR